MNDLGVYQPIWDLQYASRTLSSKHRPLDDVLHQPAFPCVFDDEAMLAMRLNSTVLLTVGRVLAFIDDRVQARRQHHSHLPPLFPPPLGTEPLLMEHGAVSWRNNDTRRFLPDRCALPRADMYDQVPQMPHLKPRGYLFGDIKVSYKFRGYWGRKEDASMVQIAEFRKVAAQIKFYMLALGWHGEPKASVVYGYIITDLEVVLMRRGVDSPDTIYVSQSFKLRAVDRSPEEPDDHGISGMTALVYIHLLAANRDSHSVHCRNET